MAKSRSNPEAFKFYSYFSYYLFITVWYCLLRFCKCETPAHLKESYKIFFKTSLSLERSSRWWIERNKILVFWRGRLFRRSESEGRSVVSNSLWPHGLHSPWNFPGQNTGMGSLSLLQGIFPTQGSNPGLLNCRQILYQLSHSWWLLAFQSKIPLKLTSSLFLLLFLLLHLASP